MTAIRTIEDYVNLERCVDALEDERIKLQRTIASLLEILRQWEPDWSSGEDRRTIVLAMYQIGAGDTPPSRDKSYGLLREALAWIENSQEPAPSLCGDIRKALGMTANAKVTGTTAALSPEAPVDCRVGRQTVKRRDDG